MVEGVPAGLRLSAQDINLDLARRQQGYGRGGRMKIETDTAEITAGVRHGHTLGGPIAMFIRNADFSNWQEVMSVEELPAGPPSGKTVTVPRPGHADLAGVQKFGFGDIRSVLERASARETAARVAVGAIAKRLLDDFGVGIFSRVIQIGAVKAGKRARLVAEDFSLVEKSPVRCMDAEASKKMVGAIKEARKQGESLGGVFEIYAFGLVPGLGSYTSGEERLGGRLAGAIMGIPAIKGVEVGEGFALASRPGSKAHDEIFHGANKGFFRRTNHAGGLEGGMTTGEPLVLRACMKPIPTLTKPLRSVDVTSGHPVPAHKERSDVCAVPAAAVVAEAAAAIVLAQVMLEKFAGDCVGDMKESYLAYLRRIKRSWPSA